MKTIGFVSLKEFRKWKMPPGEAVTMFSYNLKKPNDETMTNVDQTAREQHI